MAKRIATILDLKDVCSSAGWWYVGSFMSEFMDNREKWQNPDTKGRFVTYMYNNYGASDSDISGTRTRVNCVIRIIESAMVEEALNFVLRADERKLGCAQSKINARETLEDIKNGKYPWYKER